MSISETLKTAIDDLDLDRRVDEFTKLAQKALDDAKAQAGTLAHDNRERVDGWLAKASSTVDERTDGKYADKLHKLTVSVGSLVDKVAEQRPEGDYQAEHARPTAFTPEHPDPSAAAVVPSHVQDAPSDAWAAATDPASATDVPSTTDAAASFAHTEDDDPAAHI